MQLLSLEWTQVTPDPDQPRKVFDRYDLDELKRTIRLVGQIVPARVRSLGQGKYLIVDGERRWRVGQELFHEHPGDQRFARFVAVDADDSESNQLIIQYIANAVRRGHNTFEKAQVISRLKKEDVSDDDVRNSLGMSQGEYRYLKQFSRSPAWLQEFGKPVTLKAPAVDEDGRPVLEADGTPRESRKTFEPLPISCLIELVKLHRKLHEHDEMLLKDTGGAHRPVAVKVVTRAAEKALRREWSFSRLVAECSKLAARYTRAGETTQVDTTAAVPPPPRPTSFSLSETRLTVDLQKISAASPEEARELYKTLEKLLGDVQAVLRARKS